MTEYCSVREGVSYANACSGAPDQIQNAVIEIGKVVYEKGSVFSNEGLLGKIFQHLSFEDLKSSRQVNHLWNIEATKVLLEKFRTKPIRISHDKVTLLKGKEENPTMSMNAFSKFIGKSTSFPLTILLNKSSHNLRPAQKANLVNLFKWYGHVFKSLEFSEEVTKENRTFVEELLTQLLPNLQVLTIIGCSSDLFVNTSTNSNEALKFEKLKTLHLVGSAISPVVLSAVFGISKKLENIYFWEKSACYKNVIDSYEKLKEFNALHLLRSLDLHFHKESLKFLESLLSDKQLTNLKVISRLSFDEGPVEDEIESPFDWARVGRILTAFFQKNYNTLESMRNVHQLGKIPKDSLTLPVFPNMSRLDFFCSHFEDKSLPVFPLALGVELATTFPSLTRITLNIQESREKNMCPSSLFPGNQRPLLTVRSVQIKDRWKLGTSWVEFAHRMFPNVVKADFGALGDFNCASEFLWGLQCLEELQLGIAIGYNEQVFHKYDSAFTGLSDETVEKLFRTPKKNLDRLTVKDLKALRSRASITDLQRLRKLRVEFLDNRKQWYAIWGFDFEGPSLHASLSRFSQMILSHVSGRFAFHMCPKLLSNVQITLSLDRVVHCCCCSELFNVRDAFRTLVPFVRPISYDADRGFLTESPEPARMCMDEDDQYIY